MKGFGEEVERRLEARDVARESGALSTVTERVSSLLEACGYISGPSQEIVELDSLERIGLVVDLGWEFDIDISDEDAYKIAPGSFLSGSATAYVGRIVDYVSSRLGNSVEQ